MPKGAASRIESTNTYKTAIVDQPSQAERDYLDLVETRLVPITPSQNPYRMMCDPSLTYTPISSSLWLTSSLAMFSCICASLGTLIHHLSKSTFALSLIMPMRQCADEVGDVGEKSLNFGELNGAAKWREASEKFLAVRSSCQPRVEHCHNTPILCRTDEPPRALSQQCGGARHVDRVKRLPPDPLTARNHEWLVGAGKGDAIHYHQRQ